MWIEVIGGGVFAATGVMAYGVRGRSSRLFGPSVWRGPADRPAVALTFDDGPSESTPQVLELLERHGARATFFQCGRNVRRLPAVAREVAAAGHEIGNHTDSHAPLYFRSAREIGEEVERAQEAIAGATGVRPALFRAPYGARWFGVGAVERRLGLLGVMWTVIARDWKLPAEAIARRVLARVGNGAIVCLHDGRGIQAAPEVRPTLDALGRLLPELRSRGFRFDTVSELICPTT